jgi:hypothetical protein
MSNNHDFKKALSNLASFESIEIIIESGTYNGLGSSTSIAIAFQNSKKLEKFYTCEVDLQSYREAKYNLSKFPFVKCCLGTSVSKNEAIQFIKSDQAIRHHEDYPEVFIDDTHNPVDFYINEIKGHLIDSKNDVLRSLQKWIISRNNLLRKLIAQNIDRKMLIVLDSAGGIGHLEFMIVNELLSKVEFYILLDDTHHLKHFRGYKEIKNNKAYSILAASELDGWVLAKHSPKNCP